MRPIRVLIISDRAGYCFTRRAEAIQRHAPERVQVEIVHYSYADMSEIPYSQYDVVYCLPPQVAREVRGNMEAAGADVPLVVAWNSGVGRIGYDVAEAWQSADYMVCNNYAAWIDAKRRISDFRGCHISNGVDTATFRSTVPIADRPQRVLWIASEHKANDPYDVKGWHTIAAPLASMLQGSGVECDFRVVPEAEEMTADQMRDWYNTGSVFLVTSTSEGTPNTALEAAACGCVVCTPPVGNMRELISSGINGVIIEKRSNWNISWVYMAVKRALAEREKFSAAMARKIPEWDWAKRVPHYVGVFDAMARRLQLENFSYLDRRTVQ
jgi:glycosyltransferase involved in cell wall biosynthesis